MLWILWSNMGKVRSIHTIDSTWFAKARTCWQWLERVQYIYLPSPWKKQKMLWISVGLPRMDQTVWFTWISVWFTQFTPLHLIRWGSKTSGLSSTLNYAWSFEVAHFSEEGWRLLWKDLGIPWISLAKWFPPQMYDPTLAFLVVHSSPTKGPALNSCACTVDWNISWWMPLPGFFSVSKRISCFWVFRSMPSFFWYNSWSFPIQFTWLNWTSPNRKRLNMHEKGYSWENHYISGTINLKQFLATEVGEKWLKPSEPISFPIHHVEPSWTINFGGHISRHTPLKNAQNPLYHLPTHFLTQGRVHKLYKSI